MLTVTWKASTIQPQNGVNPTSQAVDRLSNEPHKSQLVRIERDMQAYWVSGFRTLGVASTFIAGVEAQCLSLTFNNHTETPGTPGTPETPEKPFIKVANAFLLIGLLFSTFGAASSLLAARWFDLLRGAEVDLLEYRWGKSNKRATGELEPNAGKMYTQKDEHYMDEIQEKARDISNKNDRVLAKAIFYPFYFVMIGFLSLIVGIILFIWATQHKATAAVCTAITVLGTIVLVCLHLDFYTMGTLAHMEFKRIRIPLERNREPLLVLLVNEISETWLESSLITAYFDLVQKWLDAIGPPWSWISH
ncbi:hypothetical protein BDV93DRAFT_514530 [Ceratobasidium sp. AG-I]|nr:hypothetical protein BDV93DRAFT_514530 [Ceratobasidium sp. AG-I]